MIKIDNEKAKIEFGSGDIGFTTYLRTDTEEKGLIFYNQEPREIGAEGDLKANTFIDREDFPVQMIFRTVESIDVFIKALEDLKELMKPNPYDLGHHFICEDCGDMFDIKDIKLANGDELCNECFNNLEFD